MAASSADFEWYNDVDDEHPIGQGPTTSSTANSSSPQTLVTTTPGSSAVPFDHVRQLRGQPKLAINMPSTGHTRAQAVAKARRNNSRKRPHSNDDNGSVRKLSKTTVQGQKKAAIPIDSKSQKDDADSTDHGSSSDDDDDLSVKDKCVSLFCIIRLSTDMIDYRNA